MLRNTVFASLIALAAGTAQAQNYPALAGSGDNAVVLYGDNRPGSVVGGADVLSSGYGDDAVLTVRAPRAVTARVARLIGSNDNAEVVYLSPEGGIERGLAGYGPFAPGG